MHAVHFRLIKLNKKTLLHLKISICLLMLISFVKLDVIQACKSVGLTWNCQNIQCQSKHVCIIDTEQYHSVVVWISFSFA